MLNLFLCRVYPAAADWEYNRYLLDCNKTITERAPDQSIIDEQVYMYGTLEGQPPSTLPNSFILFAQ